MRKKLTGPAAVLAAAAILYICALKSRSFANLYTQHVFPVVSQPLMRFSDLFPFSVGEVMITTGILWVLVFAVSAAVTLLLRKKAAVRRFFARFSLVTLWIVAVVVLIMVLNCAIQYRASGLTDPVLSEEEKEQVYGLENLTALRDYVVETADAMAEEVERDGSGAPVFAESYTEGAARCMEALSEDYPQLKGYYPRAKSMFYSDLMCQADMCGYYFPFSMEANYNGEMTACNYPYTICHELAHLKGYLKEDDCNMLAFLGCIRSDDPSVVYCGYLNILNYVDNAWYKAIGKDSETYYSHVAVSEQVREDNTYITEETRQRVDAKYPWKRETVKTASSTFTDKTLKANGVSVGMQSYSLVVRHLLSWFSEENIDGRNS